MYNESADRTIISIEMLRIYIGVFPSMALSIKDCKKMEVLVPTRIHASAPAKESRHSFLYSLNNAYILCDVEYCFSLFTKLTVGVAIIM